MSGRGFTSAFAAELDAYLAFKQNMGHHGASRIWYLTRFDAWCRVRHVQSRVRVNVQRLLGVSAGAAV